MNLSSPKVYFLISLPFFLFVSTALVFVSLTQWLGKEMGYVLGFVFYYLVWCILVPLICLGKDGFLSLFSEETPLFSKMNWLPAILLLATTIGAGVMYFSNIRNIGDIPIGLVLIGIPVAIINGSCEEILWRGLYSSVFPGRFFLGLIYPAIGFAVWHMSPQLVFPSEGGRLVFVVSTFFLGLVYGWVAYGTGSVKWTALSHSLNGILALGAPISTSILALISGLPG